MAEWPCCHDPLRFSPWSPRFRASLLSQTNKSGQPSRSRAFPSSSRRQFFIAWGAGNLGFPRCEGKGAEALENWGFHVAPRRPEFWGFHPAPKIWGSMSRLKSGVPARRLKSGASMSRQIFGVSMSRLKFGGSARRKHFGVSKSCPGAQARGNLGFPCRATTETGGD